MRSKYNFAKPLVLIIICSLLLITITADWWRKPQKGLQGINEYNKNLELALQFIEEKLSGPSKGIYTNYLPSNKRKEYATGHEILAESEGLIMSFYLKTREQQKYDWHFDFLTEKMISPTNSLRWRVSEDTRSGSNISASVDDLRVIRALFEGYQLWGNSKYQQLYLKLEKALRQKSVVDSYLVDYYHQDLPASVTTLSYLDLKTIKLLTNINSEWDNVYKSSLSIIKRGFISDSLPMYYKQYDLNRENFVHDDTINLIDSLLTLLHLAEVNQHSDLSIDWLKEQISVHGRLYCVYDLDSGEPSPAQHYESTAVYAIAMRVCLVLDEYELYHTLAAMMLELQVMDLNNEVYGAFADGRSLQAYSYDNLQAILALKGYNRK